MKPRAKTIQQRFGFKDPDLTTPSHDKIILALLNKEKMVDIIMVAMGEKKPGIYLSCEDKIHYDSAYCSNLKRKCAFFRDSGPATDCPHFEEADKEHRFHKNITLKQHLIKNMNIVTEFPISSEKYIIGFIDLKVYFSDRAEGRFFNFESRLPPCYIEVKTKISSFGETMRQINMYRKYIRNVRTGFGLPVACPFILVTETRGFKEAFESQGVHVYEWGTQSTLS